MGGVCSQISVCGQGTSAGDVEVIGAGPVVDPSLLQFTEKEFENGRLYKGQVHVNTGERCGEGTYSYEVDGSPHEYSGQWSADVCNGNGSFEDADSAFEGQWVDGRKHGYGKEKWFEEETTYKGAYVSGDKHGEGEYKWWDGSSYTGQFMNDEISGVGTKTDSDGTYVGQFEESVHHGEGKYDFADGSCYQGQWYYGERHGNGKLTWKDGKYYDGHWETDQRHGRGMSTDASGSSKESFFFEGKKCNSQEELEEKLIAVGRSKTLSRAHKPRSSQSG